MVTKKVDHFRGPSIIVFLAQLYFTVASDWLSAIIQNKHILYKTKHILIYS
jgi:hypothetical protein